MKKLLLLCLAAFLLAVPTAQGAKKIAADTETSEPPPPPPTCVAIDKAPVASPKTEEERIQSQEQVENATICLINRERRAKHLSEVHRTRIITQIAREHSRNMVQYSYFSHNGQDGTLRERFEAVGYFTGFNTWTIGEIIYWGGPLKNATPEHAVRAWMNSPGHREIILTPQYTEVGAGASVTPPGWDGESLEGAVYTMDFATEF